MHASQTGKRGPRRDTVPSPGSDPPVHRKKTATERLGGIRRESSVIQLRHLHQVGASDIWILCEGIGDFPVGTCFLPDRLLEKNEGISHKAYKGGIYSLLRGIWYTELSQRHEVRQLQEDQECAVFCSSLLLLPAHRRTPKSDVEAVRWYQQIAGSLFRSRDPRKKAARQNIGRAMQSKDRRGRNNAPARTMAAGGGIRRMEQRQAHLQQLQNVVRSRKEAVARLLDRYMEVFLRTLAAVQELPNLERWGFFQGVDLKNLGRDGQRMALHEQLMKEVIWDLELLERIPPFAPHIRALLFHAYRARDGAHADDRKAYGEATSAMRQRMEWIALRHSLECGVIGNLGLLLKRLFYRARKNAKRNDVPFSEDDMMYRAAMDPVAFDAVVNRIKDWCELAKRVRDDAFPEPFQGKVMHHCHTAIVHASHDEWRTVKEELKRAARLIGAA